MLNRRRFLQVSGALTLTPLLPAASRSFASPTAAVNINKFFVSVRVLGGMDVTLGLDPWLAATKPLESDMFIEYRQDELIDCGSLKLGPAAAPLKVHAGDFSVVNGVFMSQADNGHGASGDYIVAGSSAPTAPALAAEIALATVEGDFGVINNGALRLGDRVVSISALEDLRDLPKRIDLSSLLRQIVSPNAKTAFAEAVRQVLSSGPATQNFIKNLVAFGPTESLTDAHVIAATFMAQLSGSAHLTIGSGLLDSHANHAGTHLKAQSEAWQSIADMFALFKSISHNGKSLFEQTTFMIVSEFSRTPALNGAAGKDHNPLTNSVLLAGYGVRGGQVIGASRLVTAAESASKESYHIAYPIDYATCEVQLSRTPQAQMIFPENVAQTVATIQNVDWSIFRSFPRETLPLAPLIKT